MKTHTNEYQLVQKIKIQKIQLHSIALSYPSYFFRVNMFAAKNPENPMKIHMPDHYPNVISFN